MVYKTTSTNYYDGRLRSAASIRLKLQQVGSAQEVVRETSGVRQ